MAFVAAALSLGSASAVAQSLGEPEYVDPCGSFACLDPAPTVSAPLLARVGDGKNPLPGNLAGSPDQIAVQLEWSATDPDGIREFHLERNSWGLGWTPLQGVSSRKDPMNPDREHGSISTLLQAPDIPHQFRVRAVDTAGYTSAWVYSGMIGAYDDDSPKFRYTGDPATGDPATPGWRKLFDPFFLGGSVSVTTSPISGASFSCQCRYIAWIGRAHNMGSDASVYIDGKFVGNVPQGQPTFTYRKVLFVAPFTQAGYHTIEILFGQGIELDIDAFVVDHG